MKHAPVARLTGQCLGKGGLPFWLQLALGSRSFCKGSLVELMWESESSRYTIHYQKYVDAYSSTITSHTNFKGCPHTLGHVVYHILISNIIYYMIYINEETEFNCTVLA